MPTEWHMRLLEEERQKTNGLTGAGGALRKSKHPAGNEKTVDAGTAFLAVTFTGVDAESALLPVTFGTSDAGSAGLASAFVGVDAGLTGYPTGFETIETGSAGSPGALKGVDVDPAT